MATTKFSIDDQVFMIHKNECMIGTIDTITITSEKVTYGLKVNGRNSRTNRTEDKIFKKKQELLNSL